MMTTKLWLIIGAVVLVLLLAVLLLGRSTTPAPATNDARADAAHNAFMVDGGANDKGTGKSFKLGAAPQKQKPANAN